MRIWCAGDCGRRVQTSGYRIRYCRACTEREGREIVEERLRHVYGLDSFLHGIVEFIWYANPPEDDEDGSRAAERAAVLALFTPADQERIAYYVENLRTETLEVSP